MSDDVADAWGVDAARRGEGGDQVERRPAMTIIDCVQLSPEWFEARRGLPTASNFDRICTPKTMKLAAAAEEYINELIAEKLHIGPLSELPTPMSKAMLHGVDCEPEARNYYALERGVTVKQVGLCVTDDGRFGCSPDGLVNGDGVLELKCPTPKVHIGYYRDGVLPAEYKGQVHGELIVTGLPWVDFMSYCPSLPAPHNAFIVRVVPDEFTLSLKNALDVFHDRLQAALEKIWGM